jgi:DNA-binding beta-propeller fold protein YncE
VIGVRGSRGCARLSGGQRAALGDHVELTRSVRVLALLGLVLGAGLLTSAPALALSQRGHVFSFAFAVPHPGGVAVNDSTGDVYVVATKAKQVDQFKPLESGGELTGEELVGKVAVATPDAIAVDNSTEVSDPSRGDVYVVAQNDKSISKFTATGTPVYSELKKFEVEGKKEKFEGIGGVAADSHGTLLVYEKSNQIVVLDDAEHNKAKAIDSTGLTRAGKDGFAVDPAGDAYVGTEAEGIAAVERETEEGRGQMPVVAKIEPEPEPSSGKVLTGELDSEYTTAVAVDPNTSEAYIDNVTFGPGGKPVSTVAAFTSGGSLIQRFGAPGLSEAEGVAVDPSGQVVYVTDEATGRVDVFELEPPARPRIEDLSAQELGPSPGVSNATKLSAQVDPTGADTHYHFEYGTASCSSGPPACTKSPAVDAGAGFGDQAASLELQNLAPGRYHYRVIAENSFDTTESAEQTFDIVSFTSALPDGRAWEMVSPPNKGGAEPEALTNEGGRIQAAQDGGAITYVADGPMPAGSEPEGVRSPEYTQILSTRSSHGWSSQDITTANTASTGLLTAIGPEYRAFSSNLALALLTPPAGNAGAGSLEKTPLSPPENGEAGEQEKTTYLRADAPLLPEESEVANYNLAKENGPKMEPHNPGFLALVTKLNAPGGEPFGGGENEGVVADASTPDLSHVVFTSWRAASGLYEWVGAKKKLQEVSVLPGGSTRVGAEEAFLGQRNLDVRHAISDDGSLVFWGSATKHLYVRDTQSQETLQIDTPAAGAGEGPTDAVYETASADGSKVFFTDTQRLTTDSRAGKNEEADLYVFELSAGSPLSGTLRDLTPEGISGGAARVLGNSGKGGGVIGASEDGSYVYFVADGALARGATRGDCTTSPSPQPHTATCNLYVRHFDGSKWAPTKFLATLSSEDRPDWGGSGSAADLADMTARVSPEGKYLAFMSDMSLTGYDNEDVSSGAPGERLDEEVYLYDAETERIVCASCNPTGARPVGVFDFGNHGAESGEGLGLVVDRRQIWGEGAPVDHWLAASIPGWVTATTEAAGNQPDYLSDSGRLFFDSADALAPLAKPTKTASVDGHQQQVGVENVYEYEPGGLGGCTNEGGCVAPISSGTSEHESAFLDASTSGNEVFFLTAAKLAPQDVDGNFDVYDAHVCEAASPCPPPPSPPPLPCQGEECQGGYSAPAPFATPGTASSDGSGNLTPQAQVLGNQSSKPPPPKPKPLTRAQKLAKALKTCRTKYKHDKGKRQGCEKQARKKYGPIKAVVKKPSGPTK